MVPTGLSPTQLQQIYICRDSPNIGYGLRIKIQFFCWSLVVVLMVRVGPCQRSKMKAVLILLRLNYYSLYLPGWLPGWEPEPIIVGQLAGSLGGSSSCSQETHRVDFLLEFRNILCLFVFFIHQTSNNNWSFFRICYQFLQTLYWDSKIF